eukprot:595267-Rhodomonas_salina.1
MAGRLRGCGVLCVVLACTRHRCTQGSIRHAATVGHGTRLLWTARLCWNQGEVGQGVHSVQGVVPAS